MSSSVSDERSVIDEVFSDVIRDKFEIYSYRGAATILSQNFKNQFKKIVEILENFEITTRMIRMPGGSKGLVAKHVEELFAESDWQETRIVADLHVKLLSPTGNKILRDYIRKGHLSGHSIDFVCGKVAFDLEWNSKDQTYDRDLYAFSAFHAAGAIDVGILLTRGNSLDIKFFRNLGKVLTKSGDEGSNDVYRKFGASTTYMDKLLNRLDAGRNGGCPILALGIKPQCVTDYKG